MSIHGIEVQPSSQEDEETLSLTEEQRQSMQHAMTERFKQIRETHQVGG
jgi:hypothetical protein